MKYLNLTLLILFPVAWFAPLLRAAILPIFGMDEISVITGLQSLWESDAGLALLVTFLAIFAPLLAPHSPYVGDLANARLLTPGPGHWLGTDYVGRDIFTGIVYGGRATLAVALAATAFNLVIGLTCRPRARVN